MNVTLPNGTVVTDVPDDITQVELARIAVKNNLATAEDFGDLLSDDDTTTLGALGEFGKRALGGVGTGAARVVSGLGQLLPGVDDKSLIEKEMAVRQSVSEALDYDPAYDENYIAQLGQSCWGDGASSSLFLPSRRHTRKSGSTSNNDWPCSL